MDVELTGKIAERLCAASGWEGPVYVDHGASAAVYKVVRPGQGVAALKIYDPKYFSGHDEIIEAKRCALQEELKDHSHPNLIDTLGVGELKEDKTWYLLMEFCPWPSMEKRIAQIPDQKVSSLIKKLAEAVIFLERLGYVHRDIKPANIAISDDFEDLKLLDLGVLRKLNPDEGSGTDGNEKRRFVATAQYSPPEFLTRDELPGSEGFKAINVYQVGAVLHDMIMKESLFAAEAATKNKYIIYKAVTTKTPRVSSATVSVRLVSLCSCALEKDPHRRIERVALTDFLADADDSEALRRRLAAGPQSMTVRAPSLQVAESAVRSWIGTAARIEAATLGSTSIHRDDVANGIQWAITFSRVAGTVLVRLAVAGTKLRLEVVSSTTPPVANTVVEIDNQGPDLSVTSIPPALAALYLYALSLNNSVDRDVRDDAGLAE